MIKDIVVIDVDTPESGVRDDLNYKEKVYNITINDGTTYNINLRSMIDRSYNQPYNKHKDFYKSFIFIWNGNVYPVYGAEELRLLASKVDGKDNLELGEVVAMWYRFQGRNSVIFYFYEVL